MNSFLRFAILAVSLSVALTVFSAPQAGAGVYPEVHAVEVAADAPDSSVELVGYLYFPDSKTYTRPPLVVLLHEKGRNNSLWNDLVPALCADGWAVFSMDLRGHGLSIYDLKRKKNRPQNTFYPGDFEHFPDDVAFLVDYISAKHGTSLDTSSIAVIGAALGANTGMLYAAGEPQVKYVALISPGLDYNGLRIAEAVRDYENRPLFFAVSAKDVYAAESCYLISDLCPRILDIAVYEGYQHGTRLVTYNSELRSKLRADLKRYLK